jgi:mono-ADP-ribosyltransferase sirtuin 6
MAKVNIHAFSDTIMQGIMERLGIPIPPWIVRRRVRVTRENTSDDNNYQILIEGRDPDNTDIPFSLFKSIQINSGDKKIKQINQEPFLFEISKINSNQINIQLHFFGHYNEIPFNLNYTNIKNIPHKEEFYLFYNPMIGQWHKTTKDDDFPL